MTDAIFRTTCARCAAQLEVTDATADAVSKAHEAGCFVVGDWVRWDGLVVDDSQSGRWLEGEVVTSEVDNNQVTVRLAASSDRGFANVVILTTRTYTGIGTIRRIPRPEQAADSFAVRIAKREIAALHQPCTGTWIHAESLIYHCSQECGHPGNCYDAPPLRSEPIGYEAPIRFDAGPSRPARSVKVDPLDVLYDCETLRSLLMLDAANLRGEGEMRTDGKLWMFTPAQRAAVSAHWSAELRARIAASKERERLTVVIEHDCDGDPW